MQASAEQYLENVRHSEESCRQMELKANADVLEKMARADVEAQKYLADVKLKADQQLLDAKQQSEQLIAEAQTKGSFYWVNTSPETEHFSREK